jgi:glycosyltransferase involved in cell wall biosynthesis
MRIAQYYPWVYLTSGVERVILEICRRSRHRHSIFTNHFAPANTYPEFRDLEVIELPGVSVERSLWPVLRAAIRIASMKIGLESFDALLVHCDGLGDLILNRQRDIPVVCMCHTPLRPVFDVHYAHRAAERYKGARRLGFRLFSAGFKAVDQKMWSRYRYVVFNSKEAQRRAQDGGLLRSLNGNHEVLHPGIDWHGIEPTWRHEAYFLVAGRIMWTKNVETAIRGFVHFKNMCAAHRPFRLIVAGAVDAKSEPYLAGLREIAQNRDDIEFIISPTDQVLHGLYANCYAALFPSFNEDWGMVPLEANAYGKPVIAVNCGGPLESQVPGKTGFLVPAVPEAFAKAMAVLAEDEQLVRTIGEQARQHALKYDWSHFVGRMDDVLDKWGGVETSPSAEAYLKMNNSVSLRRRK